MKLISLIISLLICVAGYSQNLVPNGDFEQFSQCPANISQLQGYATDWFNPSTGTPDYFNQCASASTVGVPANSRGWQNAHSGVAYCGIVLARENSNLNFREYIEVQMLSTLTAETCYNFEMYISLGDISQYTTDDIQVYLSDTAITGFLTTDPLPFIPQINNATGNFPDTTNWILVTGNYTASGTENYLLIGNFKDHTNSNTIQVNPTVTNIAFAFIDDISFTPCLPTETREEVKIAEVSVFPNPATNQLSINSNTNELSEVVLYDIASRKITNQLFINSVTFNIEQLVNGIYIYEVRNKNGLVKEGKVVKY